jgi:lichenan operon transcriptional antiterminator
MDGLDFIVSTIPIPDNLPIPVIEVNTILGTNDFEKIENIMLEKKHKTIKYTREELVFLQQNLETKEKVIHFLGDKLQKLGLVNEEFIASVFEREAISPTCFGNLVAVPHPIMPHTDTTFWTVCTLQKPITWEDKRVQFVCLLSVQKNSNEDLQKMYNLLGNVIDDIHIVQRLLKCRTYQEFIDVFLRQK